MNSLGVAYQTAGDLVRAEALLERAVELMRSKLGADHPRALTSMNNLAASYWSTNQLDRSIPLFEEASRLQEKRLGCGHPDTQNTVANLGVNYKDAGRLDEAIPLLEEAERASRAIPSLQGVVVPLLDAYARAGDVEKVRQLIERRLAEGSAATPANRPQRAGMLAQFGSTLVRMGAFAEAEPLLREAITIRQEVQPDEWTTFNTKSLLGGALLGQGRADEAEPLLREGYEGMKERVEKIPPQNTVRLVEALGRLIDRAEAAGKADEAERWRTERAEFEKMDPPPPDGSK